MEDLMLFFVMLLNFLESWSDKTSSFEFNLMSTWGILIDVFPLSSQLIKKLIYRLIAN